MKRSLAVLALLGLLSTACAGPAEPPPSSIQVLDKTKLTAVEANLKTDAELASCGIQVSAENDMVVLKGSVPSEEARAKAEALARKVEGIQKVANHLVVGQE